MQLTQYYRTFDLPWDPDPEEQRRFRRYLLVGLGAVLFVGLILPFVNLPKRAVSAEEAVPPRLARLMEQQLPKPPPPKPVEQPKEKPKAVPQPTPKPVDTRKKMANSAAMRAIKDELADLRDQLDTKTLQDRQLTTAVSQDQRSERSLISSKVGTGSAGIVTANASRGLVRAPARCPITTPPRSTPASPGMRRGIASAAMALAARRRAVKRRLPWSSIAIRAPSTPCTAVRCASGPTCRVSWCCD